MTTLVLRPATSSGTTRDLQPPDRLLLDVTAAARSARVAGGSVVVVVVGGGVGQGPEASQ